MAGARDAEALRWLPLVVLVACAPTESRPDPALNSATGQPYVAPAPESEVEAGCDATAVAAARTALAAALAKQVDPSVLADCEPEQIVCATERGPLERAQSCQVVGDSSGGGWAVVIIPRPATGAPTRIEVWVDPGGAEAGRVDISGSTWGVVDGVVIEGRGEYAIHTHGGAPAWIGGATFVVENHRDQPIELELTGTRWLVARSCELPREQQARPKPAGLALGDELVDGEMTVTIPAGATKTVSLGHQVQEAYMVHCDRFATAASFEIGGQTVEVIAEHDVIREEPLRDE